MRKTICILFVIAFNFSAIAQNTFQKLYTPSVGGAECFGSYQLSDGGYIFTGITMETTNKVFVSRTDCEGTVLWSKTYNNSSTIGNISQRVIPLKAGGFCLAASIGQYNAYNILIVKMDNQGNTVWQKIMAGSGDDVVNSIIETRSGSLVIVGHTNSFGQDAGSSYTDIYIAKLDANGNYIWGRAVGTHANIDQAFDVVEASDSNYVATGRYIEQGTFYTCLLKMDTLGNVQWLKAYGDTNQHTFGYALIACASGGFALVGSTTIMKTNYQSYADNFIIRTDANGDTLWCRTYRGSNPDNDENASSIIELPNGFAIGVATMSYPGSVNFVPNKQVIIKTDLQGNMTMVKSYNDGGSHYPYITMPYNRVGALLSGFTTNYSSSIFKPLLIRTDNNFNSGCNETDLLSQTYMEHPPFQVRIPAYVIANGGSLINSTISANLTWVDSMLCSHIVDSCSIHQGVEELSANAHGKVWYDPTSKRIVMEGFDSNVTDVEVYDLVGRMVYNQKTSAPISFQKSLVESIYFVVIKSKESIHSFKVLIQ